MRTAPAVSLVLGAAGVLVGATLFFSDGSRDARVFPLGTAVVVAAAALVVGALLGALPRPALARSAVAFLALFGAFTLWSGLSVQWSIAGEDSWAYFNRDVVYLSFAVLGLFTAALASRRAIAGTVALLLGLVIGWALLGKVVPGLFPDGARLARLRDPVGYWNGLALLCGTALVLGLWLASTRAFRPLVRAAGALLVYGASVALVLTYSRAGIGVTVLAALAWVVLGRAAFDAIVALVLTVPAALGVVAFALSLPGVADDGQSASKRVHDGRLFGVVLVAVALVVLGIARALAGRRPPGPARQRLVVRWAAGATGVAVLAVAVAVVARGGGPGSWLETQWNQFRSSDVAVSNEAGRLGSLSSNNRWEWWQEAWRGFRREPLIGQGAGSFTLLHRIERTNDIAVRQPHNVALQFLSDTGIVGFLLALGAFVAALAAAGANVRRLEGAERGAVLALTIGVGAFCAHSLVDIDWEYLAITGPVFFVLGAALPAGGAAAAVRRPAWAMGAAAIGLVIVSSLFAPWLANRRVESAYDAIGRGAYADAAGDAKQAHALNPLAAAPLLVWGLASELGGDEAEAGRRYREAVDLQPKNPDTWFYLGVFELEHLRRPRLAYRDLVRSRELDPYGSPELDDLIARARAGLASGSRR